MTTATTRTRKAAPPDPDLHGGLESSPDLPDPLTVTAAWSRVMGDVQAVGKDSRNTQQNFNFRGIDAVMNAVGPALRTHGVTVVPTHVEVIERRVYDTRSGTAMVGTVVGVGYRIVGPGGDWIDGWSVGEASDSGDKGVTKAMSVAYRTFLLQALCIPTDQPDPDHTTFTAVTGAPTTTSAGETLTMDGRAGYDRLKEIAKIPDQSDRIKAVAEWTDKAQALGVMEEKVLHGGRLRTLASVATELSSNASQTLGSTDA